MKMTSEINGGQALIESLKREGIRTVFGIPGVGQYEAIDALYSAREIQYISVRNEQAATYMADGYARASGEIAAALLVPGPGLYNATAGMVTAHVSSSPMLVISGARGASTPDADSDELAIMKRLTKWSGAAFRVADIPGLVQEAGRQLREGTPHPVGLDISPKIFAGVETVELLDPAPVEHRLLPTAPIEEAARLLAGASSPVIWVGAGVQRAGAFSQIVDLAEYLQIPVVTSRQGKGAISDRHPLSLGYAEQKYAPLRQWLAERDTILAIGTSTDLTAYSQQQIIRIDADPAVVEGGSQQRVLGILGDVKIVVEALLTAVTSTVSSREEKKEAVEAEVNSLNRARFGPEGQLHPQWELMIAIRNAMPDDGVFVQGMNQMGYYSRNYYPVFGPRAYITSSTHSTLGCAYPLALGAKVAQPERTVVAISGDGGFLYNAQEMATAVQYDINAVVVVFNDNAYGNVLRAQEEVFDGHVIGTKLYNPDFMKLAKAYGVNGILAEDADALEVALHTAIQKEEPTLIEVPVGPMERVY